MNVTRTRFNQFPGSTPPTPKFGAVIVDIQPGRDRGEGHIKQVDIVGKEGVPHPYSFLLPDGLYFRESGTGHTVLAALNPGIKTIQHWVDILQDSVKHLAGTKLAEYLRTDAGWQFPFPLTIEGKSGVQVSVQEFFEENRNALAEALAASKPEEWQQADSVKTSHESITLPEQRASIGQSDVIVPVLRWVNPNTPDKHFQLGDLVNPDWWRSLLP